MVSTDGDVVTCMFTIAEAGSVDGFDRAECAVGVTSDGRVQLSLFPLEGRIQIDIVRGGMLFARQIATPVYQGVFPNGFGCGAVCRVAAVEIEV